MNFVEGESKTPLKDATATAGLTSYRHTVEEWHAVNFALFPSR